MINLRQILKSHKYYFGDVHQVLHITHQVMGASLATVNFVNLKSPQKNATHVFLPTHVSQINISKNGDTKCQNIDNIYIIKFDIWLPAVTNCNIDVPCSSELKLVHTAR